MNLFFFVRKSKAIHVEAWAGPEGPRGLRLPEFIDRRNMKVVSFPALSPGSLYPQERHMVEWKRNLVAHGEAREEK